MTKLIILAGVPGAGKSTWAKTFFDLKATIVNADTIRIAEFGSLDRAWQNDVTANNERVFAIFHRTIRDALEHGIDVIADATHLTRRSRQDVRQHAYVVGGVTTHLVTFRNTLEAVDRNSSRLGAARVSDEVQGKMLKQYYSTIADLSDGESALYDSVTTIGSFA